MSSTVDAPEVADERLGELLVRLRAELGDAVLDSHLRPNDALWVRVANESWREAGRVCRDVLGLTYFCFLSGLDWLPSPYGKGEDDPTEPPPVRSSEIVPGYTGGTGRFQVFARVYSVTQHRGLFLKADLDTDEPTIASWVPNYAGANWHERETAEMFGFRFLGHPNPVKLYLPGGFEGYPLRKDFPLLSRMVKPWPGIVDVEPMPDSADEGESDA